MLKHRITKKLNKVTAGKDTASATDASVRAAKSGAKTANSGRMSKGCNDIRSAGDSTAPGKTDAMRDAGVSNTYERTDNMRNTGVSNTYERTDNMRDSEVSTASGKTDDMRDTVVLNTSEKADDTRNTGVSDVPKKQSRFRRVLHTLGYFADHIIKDRIGVYSAQAAFFTLLSLFPIILLLLNILGHTALPVSILTEMVKNHAPESIRSFLLQMIQELQNKSSIAMISITAVVAVWASSKGTISIIYGMRDIFVADKQKSYFTLRFFSMIYTLFLIFTVTAALVLLVFGNSIFHHVERMYPVFKSLDALYSAGRYLIVMFTLMLFFVSMFKMGGNKRYKFKDLLPGAIFATFGWIIFSFIFSIYVDNVSSYSYMYGSITAVIIIMLWMYFCMYIMFIGAQINVYRMKRANGEIDW